MRLRRGDLEFEARGDREFVERSLERWAGLVFDPPTIREPDKAGDDPEARAGRMAGADRVTAAESLERAHGLPGAEDRGRRENGDRTALPAEPRRISVRRNITFQDFLKLKEPDNALDKLLTLSYFLEKYEGRPRYDLSELDAAWNDAFPRDAFHPEVWRDAIEEGYLEENGGMFTLTFSGEAYVQNGLSDRFKPRPYGRGREQYPPT